MLFRTNREALERLAKNFYTLTQTAVTIYDADCQVICAQPHQYAPFCAQIRQHPELLARCRECDEAGFAQCHRTGKTHFYRCHMGLLEVATPIVCNGTVIGYMLLGQIAPDADRSAIREAADRAAVRYGLDKEALHEAIPCIRHRTEDYIRALAELLEMCANHIWLNSIISVHNQGLACSIDHHIQQNLDKPLTVPELCDIFSISRGTLYNLAKENFGCSITEYVIRCRISTAKRLLARTERSVAEIAGQVGYPDTNYFIRIFKQHTGITPGTYRRSLSGHQNRSGETPS